MSTDNSIFNRLQDTLDNNPRRARDLFEVLGFSPVVFPPSLGTETENNGIPYVLFMPYMNSPGLHQLHSVDPNHVLDTIPPPKFAIALPLPASALSTEYGVEYGEVELNGWGSIATGVSGLLRTATTPAKGDGVIEKFADVVKNAGANVGGVVAHAGYSILENLADVLPGNAEGLKKMTGVVPNPFTEHIFKNVKFRSHSFTYKFVPKNVEQARTVDQIVQLFKFYMLPNNAGPTGSHFFSFPYEFQIIYSVSDTTFALLPSVLESMSVSYSEGLASPKFFLADSTGKRYPVSTSITLKFNEVMLLTRDKVKASGSEDVKNEIDETPGFRRYRF